MNNTFDPDIRQVLEKASCEDLDPLVQYITNAFTESLTSNELYTKHQPQHTRYVGLIANEICAFGGNTIVNLFRGSGPTYAEVVADVAEKVGANVPPNADVAEVETAIILRNLGLSWSKLDNEERLALLQEMGIKCSAGKIPKSMPQQALYAVFNENALIAYKIALLVGNSMAVSVLGRGLTFAADAAVERGLLSATPLLSRLNWVLTGLWLAYEISGPAYRVTIPCVTHIALLRRKQALSFCRECESPLTQCDRYCPNCGFPQDLRAVA